MSRVLVDTNVLISAFLFPNSTPARALALVLDEHRGVLLGTRLRLGRAGPEDFSTSTALRLTRDPRLTERFATAELTVLASTFSGRTGVQSTVCSTQSPWAQRRAARAREGRWGSKGNWPGSMTHTPVAVRRLSPLGGRLRLIDRDYEQPQTPHRDPGPRPWIDPRTAPTKAPSCGSQGPPYQSQTFRTDVPPGRRPERLRLSRLGQRLSQLAPGG